ncbi:MAG: TesB-like acyl-CoA thioesterase 5, partial [uncultured Frankineae bacterium]
GQLLRTARRRPLVGHRPHHRPVGRAVPARRSAQRAARPRRRALRAASRRGRRPADGRAAGRGAGRRAGAALTGGPAGAQRGARRGRPVGRRAGRRPCLGLAGPAHDAVRPVPGPPAAGPAGAEHVPAGGGLGRRLPVGGRVALRRRAVRREGAGDGVGPPAPPAGAGRGQQPPHQGAGRGGQRQRAVRRARPGDVALHQPRADRAPAPGGRRRLGVRRGPHGHLPGRRRSRHDGAARPRRPGRRGGAEPAGGAAV